MALCAQDLMQQGKLPGNILVATVMSNMALEVFMKERGGTLIRTNVGDRHVVAAMRQQGALLGGEQSGHLIFREYSTTGDGLLAALQILRIMRQRGRPLSELAGLLVPYPQELRNVHVEHKIPFEENVEIADAVARIEEGLEGRGRVLLRYSGTEPLCRVWLKGRMRTRYACMPTSLPESWKKRSDRRVLRTVRGHGSAFSDGEGDIFILLFKKE